MGHGTQEKPEERQNEEGRTDRKEEWRKKERQRERESLSAKWLI